MKKVGLVGVVASLLLSLVAVAAQKPANDQADAAKDKAKARPQMRDRMDPAAQQKMLTEQLAAAKKEHQTAMTELQGIKALALKEKATQTAAALDKLIARHEQEFQKKIEPLEQRLKRFDPAQKGQGKGREKSADKSQKGGEKRQRGDGAKTKTNK